MSGAAPIDLRTPISQQAKQLVDQALREIPKGKRAALVVIVDKDEGARAHVAARVGTGNTWKVAAAGGRKWDGQVSGQVAIVGAW